MEGVGSGRTLGHGIKYGLTPHGNGTKLSSLAEEGEKGNDNRSDSHLVATNTKGKSKPIKDRKPSLTGDFITQSCLLNSDDEDEPDLVGDNFPLSLSMTSSIDSEQGQQFLGAAGGASKTDSVPSSVHAVSFHSNDAVRFAIRSPDAREQRPASARECERSKPNLRGQKKLQRASSFSQQCSRQLSNELADIRQRANSLSAHGNPLDPNFTSSSLLVAGGDHNLEITPEIMPFKLPFLFSSSSGSQDLASPPFASSGEGGGDSSTRLLCGSALGHSPSTKGEEEGEESSCLAILKKSYLLGRELLAMARARQGPIMLLSTELVSCTNLLSLYYVIVHVASYLGGSAF